MDGNTVYDMIMGEIEPDLTTSQLPLLQQKYAGESPKETQKRSERYKSAFIEYKKRYAQYKAKQDDALRSYGHTLMSSVEDKSNAKEKAVLTNLESSISQS